MKEFIEAVKEFIRVVFIAIVSYLLTEGVVFALVEFYAVSVDPEIRAMMVGGLMAILKSAEKWLHKKGVKSPLDMKGGVLDDLAKRG